MVLVFIIIHTQDGVFQPDLVTVGSIWDFMGILLIGDLVGIATVIVTDIIMVITADTITVTAQGMHVEGMIQEIDTTIDRERAPQQNLGLLPSL